MTLLPTGYSISHAIPSVGEYQRLRDNAGLSVFEEIAAAVGLPGTFLAVVVRQAERAIGMGRIIGDGGLFFQLVDIAVEPAHQGKGIGKTIVAALLEALAGRLEAPAYVSLVADCAANRLYAQFGFAPVAPKSQGMACWLQPSLS